MNYCPNCGIRLSPTDQNTPMKSIREHAGYVLDNTDFIDKVHAAFVKHCWKYWDLAGGPDIIPSKERLRSVILNLVGTMGRDSNRASSGHFCVCRTANKQMKIFVDTRTKEKLPVLTLTPDTYTIKLERYNNALS